MFLTFDIQDSSILNYCISTFDGLLAQVYVLILRENSFDKAQVLLQKLTSVANQYVSLLILPYLTFSLNRAHALYYFHCEEYELCIKNLNPAISQCPQNESGSFAGGLAEALVLLAEAYSALDRSVLLALPLFDNSIVAT